LFLLIRTGRGAIGVVGIERTIERFANSETSENIDRDFHRLNPLAYRGLSDRLGLSDTRNNVGKTVSAAPLALSAIWSIYLVDILKLSPGDGGVGHTGACASWQILR